MSLGTVFYFASCVLSYKLGAFNTKRPGELIRFMLLAWQRGRSWMNG